MRQQQAALVVLDLDGFSWAGVTPEDAAVVEELAAAGANRSLFGLPRFADNPASALSRPGFKQPMICRQDGVPVGAAAYNRRSNQSLNVQLTCFFRDPETAVLPMAMYVRHLFWSVPLHRIHAQVPLFEGGPAYVRLLTKVGFESEGIMRGHVVVRGDIHDLAVLGLLRLEFDAWCLKKEIRLSL